MEEDPNFCQPQLDLSLAKLKILFLTNIIFQCLNNECLLTRGALPEHERLTKDYCIHIQQAREAQATRTYASVVAIDLEKVLDKVTDDILERELMNGSSDGEICIYKLPGGNLAVPLLGIEKTKLMTDFVHLRDLKVVSMFHSSML